MRRWLLAAAALIAGCGSSGSPAPNPSLVVSNGTTLTLGLVVNGTVVATLGAGAAPAPTLYPAALPPLPWTVEARTSSGRVLASMTVKPGQIRQSTDAAGVITGNSVAAEADLSCGVFMMFAGDAIPAGPPRPTGRPGDCNP